MRGRRSQFSLPNRRRERTRARPRHHRRRRRRRHRWRAIACVTRPEKWAPRRRLKSWKGNEYSTFDRCDARFRLIEIGPLNGKRANGLLNNPSRENVKILSAEGCCSAVVPRVNGEWSFRRGGSREREDGRLDETLFFWQCNLFGNTYRRLLYSTSACLAGACPLLTCLYSSGLKLD